MADERADVDESGETTPVKIFSGNANPKLARKIADYVGEPLGEVNIERFPDGEIFVKIVENIRGRDVFIIQPTCPPANENLMELLILIDAARRASAARITAVMPFYGYARQDRKDQPRVPITAKLVANLLVAAGTNRVLTMDLHAQQIQGFFDIPVDHLNAAPVMVRYLRTKRFKRPVVVSPDPGGLKMAYGYSNVMGTGLAIVAKQRMTGKDVEVHALVGDVTDCDCIIVDDMTSTAGTLCAAANLLRERGARSVHAVVSHCLLTDEGAARLREAPIDELITTDSIPQKDRPGVRIKVLSIAELMAEAILRIHNNQSVTSLFRIR